MSKIPKFGFGLVALLLVLSIYGGGKPAEAIELELTKEKKEELYNQYVEIVAEVSALYPDEQIEINPLDTFKDEYFMAPEDYREFIVDLAKSYVVVEPEASIGIKPFTTSSPITKGVSIQFSGATREIAVIGSFYIDHFLGRMGFSRIESMESKEVDSSKEFWEQTGYNGKILDAGETYDISIGGKYTENGASKPYNFTIYFYCSGTGNVS